MIWLHTPLTPETRYTIRTETELMKPGSILINVSRRALVAKALIEALKSGYLADVGLDVFKEEEDLFFEDVSDCVLHADELVRLLTVPNVLITSHQAFLTIEPLTEIARTSVAGQEAFVERSIVT